MKISLIAALDVNNGIGAKNNLLWHLPDDFKWFVKHTKGKVVVMGRNTMNSLPSALPNRRNIVVSSKNEGIRTGFEYFPSFESVLESVNATENEIMVIGGAQFYNYTLPFADQLIITRVHHVFENADVFFPKWKDEEWELIEKFEHGVDEKHQYAFDLLIYDRIKNDN